MNDLMLYVLLVVFLVHLLVFARLGWQRRQHYYLALTLTFLLLSVSTLIRLWQPDWMLAGNPVFQCFRWLAWAGAAVSIPWTLARAVRRRRAG